MFSRTLLGIFELLLHNKQLPDFVIHTLVKFALGLPYDICTCIGSNGSFSFDQKYIQ